MPQRTTNHYILSGVIQPRPTVLQFFYAIFRFFLFVGIILYVKNKTTLVNLQGACRSNQANKKNLFQFATQLRNYMFCVFNERLRVFPKGVCLSLPSPSNWPGEKTSQPGPSNLGILALEKPAKCQPRMLKLEGCDRIRSIESPHFVAICGVFFWFSQ